MELTLEDFQLLTSVSQRYENMFKRFMPKADDFDTLVGFLVELQEIHFAVMKVIPKRLQAVSEANDLATESYCNPARFFAARSTMADFNRFWRELHRSIFKKETMAAITAAYAAQQLITRIDTGFLGFYSGSEKGQDLVAKLESDNNHICITFTNGKVLELASLRDALEIAKLREVHKELTQHKVTLVR